MLRPRGDGRRIVNLGGVRERVRSLLFIDCIIGRDCVSCRQLDVGELS